MQNQQHQKPAVIRMIEKCSELSGYLSAFAILIATLIIVHQVCVRYFLGIPAVWQIEVSMYLLLLTSFIGAAYGLKYDAHVGIDLLFVKLAPRFQRWMRIFTSILSIGLTLVVGWKAAHLWWEATSQGWTADTLLATPLTIPYFILPLGMLLISLQFAVIIYNDWIWLRTHQENHEIKVLKGPDYDTELSHSYQVEKGGSL